MSKAPVTRHPSAPIFVTDGQDVRTLLSVEDAERWLEAPDVDDVVVVDAEGRRVSVRASGDYAVLESAGAVEPALQDAVAKPLVALLSGIGEDLDPGTGWSDLVEHARTNADRTNRVGRELERKLPPRAAKEPGARHRHGGRTRRGTPPATDSAPQENSD